MKRRAGILAVLAVISLLAVLMSSCGRYEVTNIRQFCPSPYYGLGQYDNNSIYVSLKNRKATAISDGTLYMTIDNGWYLESLNADLVKPNSFYLMKCGDEEWEKLAEAPLADKYKDTCIPLVVNEEERIFAITDVEDGICVYEYENEELVPNTFEIDGFEERMSHLIIGAEIRDGEGKSGTIYMSYMNYTENIELRLLTWDIAEKEFSENTVIATKEFSNGVTAKDYEAEGSMQPYIFFPDENTAEIICMGQNRMDYYLIDTSKPSPSLLEYRSLGEGIAADYYWGTNRMASSDVVRSENGDIHIVTVAINKTDEFLRESYAHLVVRNGEVIREKIFMPSSHNFVQLFVGADGQAYMLMIQNEEEVLPEGEFGEYLSGDADGFVNGVFYALSEDGVEELGAAYVDRVPFVDGSFQLTADEKERIVYICYKGYFTDDIVTCEMSY